MEKIRAIWRLFRQGEQVANPAAWKNGQITANLLAALIVALSGALKSFGIDVGVSDADSLAMGGGVLAFYNVVLTVVTSRKVGLPAGGGNPDPA